MTLKRRVKVSAYLLTWSNKYLIGSQFKMLDRRSGGHEQPPSDDDNDSRLYRRSYLLRILLENNVTRNQIQEYLTALNSRIAQFRKKIDAMHRGQELCESSLDAHETTPRPAPSM